MIRAGTRHELFQVKQEMNKTLRSCTRHFFKTRATIANITNEDVIHCFQNGLFLKTRTTTLGTTARLLPWSCVT
jgi:hypothetical protein